MAAGEEGGCGVTGVTISAAAGSSWPASAWRRPASPTVSRSASRTTATLEGSYSKIASIEMLEAIG